MSLEYKDKEHLLAKIRACGIASASNFGRGFGINLKDHEIQYLNQLIMSDMEKDEITKNITFRKGE